MHKPLILIGNLGRTQLTEPRDRLTAQKTAQPPAHLAAKVLSTLAAQFAFAGLELISEVSLDGLPRLYTLWRGKVQPLDGIEHARAFLAQIGGAHA